MRYIDSGQEKYLGYINEHQILLIVFVLYLYEDIHVVNFTKQCVSMRSKDITTHFDQYNVYTTRMVCKVCSRTNRSHIESAAEFRQMLFFLFKHVKCRNESCSL